MTDDGSGGTGSTGGTSGGSTGGMPSGSSDSGMSSDPGQSGTTTGLPNLPFQGGIFGTNDGENATLVIFASRMPSELSMPGELISGSATQSGRRPPPHHLLEGRITACAARKAAGSPPTASANPLDRTANEAAYTIAEEVVGFDVQYADGSGGWLSEWNSDPSSAASTRSASRGEGHADTAIPRFQG